MAIISPKNAFLGRKQVNLIAEKRPRTLEAFLSMSLHGLSKHMRTTHGPAIIETLRQVILLVLPHGMVHVLHIYACILHVLQTSSALYRSAHTVLHSMCLLMSSAMSVPACSDFGACHGGNCLLCCKMYV